MSVNEQNTNLASAEYWDKGYQSFSLSPMPDHYCTVRLMKKWLTAPGQGIGKSVFEMGVYPGRFLVHFGTAGYELNGIDQTQYLPRLEAWFKQHSFKMGQFSQGDIFCIDRNRKYDVVFSAGFIEHFTNFEDLVQLHADMTKPGGYVCITTPNFRGTVQNWLHRKLDDENLALHYVPSMNPAIWASVLERNEFDVIKSGYIGGFDFWVGTQHRKGWRRWLLKLIRLMLPILRKFKLPDHPAYSPECMILAQRKT